MAKQKSLFHTKLLSCLVCVSISYFYFRYFFTAFSASVFLKNFFSCFFYSYSSSLNWYVFCNSTLMYRSSTYSCWCSCCCFVFILNLHYDIFAVFEMFFSFYSFLCFLFTYFVCASFYRWIFFFIFRLFTQIFFSVWCNDFSLVTLIIFGYNRWKNIAEFFLFCCFSGSL